LLVNVSNDAWFGDSLAPHQHLEIARMRAIEFSRYLLRATNTGISAILDPKGHIIARIPQFTAAGTAAEIMPLRGATPYARTGDPPILLLALGAVLPALRRRRWSDPLRGAFS
jgi:apolipoprotein N-acyltransferase